MTMTNKALKQRIASALQAAPPAEPRCPHAGDCGGCAFQDRDYAAQVATKTDLLRAIWEGTPLAAGLDVVPSPDPFSYRTRMDYVATKGRFGLRKPGRFNYIVELETCHLIPPAAFAAALRVWQEANALGLPDYNMRTHEGFLRYIVVRRSPQDTLLLAAVTAAGEHQQAMAALAEVALAQPGVEGFHWLRNASLSDVSFGEPVQHWGVATLPMQVGAVTLHIGPNTFFQNNVHLLLPLLDAVHAAVLATPDTDPRAVAVADLYSGVGAIGLHLAPHVGQVVGVEAHAESAALADTNIAHNGATNVRSVAADVAAFLAEQEPGRFGCVVADPPRVGLGKAVCSELLRLAPRRIVYVSCNPLTQHEDVQQLAPGYALSSLRGYDMFPHTPHVEALAVLDRRT